MAINIESGSTWAEIRRHLNDRALDKTGDDMVGVLSTEEIVVKKVLDNNGNTVISPNPENNAINIYESPIGDTIYSQLEEELIFYCGGNKVPVEETFKIPIPFNRQNGRIRIFTYTGRRKDEKTWGGAAEIFFNNTPKEFRSTEYNRIYVKNKGMIDIGGLGLYLTNCYIENKEIIMTVIQTNSGDIFFGKICVSEWEVW